MRWIALILIILFTDACVDPLAIPGLNNNRLVVDGLITDQPGPHEVAVYYTLALNEVNSISYPDATVTVLDDIGNSYAFTAYDSGIHRSDPFFQAVIGRTYTLEIQLEDGTIYKSTPQKVYPAGRIEDIYAEFEPRTINTDDMFAPHDSYAVFVDAAGDGHGLFRWRTTGTYEALAHPELHMKYISPDPYSDDPPTKVPDPLPCVNVYADTDPTDEFPITVCACCTCWITERNKDVKLSNARSADDLEFNRTFVARIPFDGFRFHQKYHIVVEQLSVSEDVYEFWKGVASQEDNGIFQANLGKGKSNIVNETDPSDEVLGCFSASAVARTVLVINRSDAPVKPPKPDTVIADCRQFFKRSTNHKPPFW